MEPQNWSVPAGGRQHDVRLETDPITGKTFVRVDGRLATRPILPEEEEREFPIEGVTHLLRRQPDGTFDLDIAPPVLGTSTSTNTPPKAPQKNRAKIVSIAVAIVAVLLSRYAYSQFSYMHVPWRSYTGPSARFSVMFPGEPTENQQPIAEGRGSATVLTAGYRDHGYGVTYFDLPGTLPSSTVDPLLKKIVDAIVEKENGKLVEPAETLTFLDHPAVSFYAKVAANADHPAGYMKGKVIVCQGRRLYTIFTIVPRFQAVTWDVTEFLNSFELPRDEAWRPSEPAPAAPSAPHEVPTYPGDPRVAPEKEKEKPLSTTTAPPPPMNIHGEGH